MADTSSIGPQWPPRESSYARIKGIDNRGVIDSEEHLDDLLDRLRTLADGLGSASSDAASSKVDRLSIRALFDDRLLHAAKAKLEPWGEAIIPLAGCGEALEGKTFAYLGFNAESRRCCAKELEQAKARVKKAQKSGPRSARKMIERVGKGGYELRILGREERNEDPWLHAGLSELYSRFGWGPDETRQILANPESLIAVATAKGEDGVRSLVSAGIAELSHVHFGDGTELRIAEFTEAATREKHQGRGLYSGIVTVLMTELARRSRADLVHGGPLDMAFGECSGSDQGVLIAARHLGRQLSVTAARERDLPFPGCLPQHVPIFGAERSTPYNDFFPTYISRQRLYRFVDGEPLDSGTDASGTGDGGTGDPRRG